MCSALFVDSSTTIPLHMCTYIFMNYKNEYRFIYIYIDIDIDIDIDIYTYIRVSVFCELKGYLRAGLRSPKRIRVYPVVLSTSSVAAGCFQHGFRL